MERELRFLELAYVNVRFTRWRLAPIWGGVSLLWVLLRAFADLVRQRPDLAHWHWTHIINLSETDFPIRSSLLPFPFSPSLSTPFNFFLYFLALISYSLYLCIYRPEPELSAFLHQHWHLNFAKGHGSSTSKYFPFVCNISYLFSIYSEETVHFF